MKKAFANIIVLISFFVVFSFWLTSIASLANIAEYTSIHGKIFGIAMVYIAYWPSLIFNLPQTLGLSSQMAMRVNHIGWGVLGFLAYFVISKMGMQTKENIFKAVRRLLILFIIAIIFGAAVWFIRNFSSWIRGFLLGPVVLTYFLHIRGALSLMITQIYFLIVFLLIDTAPRDRRKFILIVFLCLHIIAGVSAAFLLR